MPYCFRNAAWQNGLSVLMPKITVSASGPFNLSNDGYFGRSASAREQHLLVVRMRAAENARWIVRATNDGITASVDPAGRVVQRLPEFVETAAALPYSYRKDQTFYTRHGDWFGWGCVGLSLVAVVARVLQQKANEVNDLQLRRETR